MRENDKVIVKLQFTHAHFRDKVYSKYRAQSATSFKSANVWQRVREARRPPFTRNAFVRTEKTPTVVCTTT